MIVSPAIDLLNGQVVRLDQGRFDRETRYARGVLEQAREFARAGATDLHVVDLNAARGDAAGNQDQIRALLRAATLRVQVGGGVRSISDIQQRLDWGAAAVVIGSMALHQLDDVEAALQVHGAQRMVLALDARQDARGQWRLPQRGWQEDTGLELFSHLQRLRELGARQFLVTDIARDGRQCGPNIELYQKLLQCFPGIELQASGGVSSLDDLRQLRVAGLSRAIVGKALLEGAFSLAEALAC
jgi:phosphoribosylformimino-5-aminoimidazole carboxamide ribotide isomerase